MEVSSKRFFLLKSRTSYITTDYVDERNYDANKTFCTVLKLHKNSPALGYVSFGNAHSSSLLLSSDSLELELLSSESSLT